jgi:hypothetical protein
MLRNSKKYGSPAYLSKRALAADAKKREVVTETEITLDTIKPTGKFFISYNKTDCLLRIEDIVHIVSYLQKNMNIRSFSCIGLGDAGLWCSLALTQTERINAALLDCNNFEPDAAAEYTRRLFIPHIRAMGGLTGVSGFINADRVIQFNSGNDSAANMTTGRIFAALNHSGKLFLTQQQLYADDIQMVITSEDGFNQVARKYRQWKSPLPEKTWKDASNSYFLSRCTGRNTLLVAYQVVSSVSVGTFSIVDLSGRSVYKEMVSGKKGLWKCRLDDLRAGMYCLHIRWGKLTRDIRLPVFR